MREKPYRILFCGQDNEQFDVVVPNYFANYKYVKVKCVNAGYDSNKNIYNIGLFCQDHCYNATYGFGINYLESSEFDSFMFNFGPLVNGSKSVYAYLPYRNLYTFYTKNLTIDPGRTDLTLILELEPINFN